VSNNISADNLGTKAKRYSYIRYGLSLIGTAYLLALLFLSVATGFSDNLSASLSVSIPNPYFIVPAYLLILYFLYYLLNFPLNLYQSFILEHKFALSNQKLGDWLLDQIKTGIISYIIGLILLAAFYAILKYSAHSWWVVVSVFWIFFSLIMAKLMPIVIIPLFFKYRKMTDLALRVRILNLADKMRVKLLDVFEIDFSKKTLKANAAFVGMGKTRRVILADTLKDKYTPEEIEVILAHEFAHYRLRHMQKLIFINSLVTLALFFIIFKTNNYTLNIFGLSSLSDLAALPVVLIYFVVFGLITGPLENFISRKLEKNADITALKITSLKEPFISLMDKLGKQNLADTDPHPIIKYFFFDHPPINERIEMARNYRP